MSLPGQIALSSRLRAAFTPVASVSMPARPSLSAQLSQALILGGLIGFQALDSLTTHLGLALHHEELNRLMRDATELHPRMERRMESSPDEGRPVPFLASPP